MQPKPACARADSCRCVAELRKFFGAPGGGAPRAAPKAEEAPPPASVVRCCKNACAPSFAGEHALTPSRTQPEVVDLVDDDDEPQQIAATPAKHVKKEPGACKPSGRPLFLFCLHVWLTLQLVLHRASCCAAVLGQARAQPHAEAAQKVRRPSLLCLLAALSTLLLTRCGCRSPKRQKDATPAKPAYPRPPCVHLVARVVCCAVSAGDLSPVLVLQAPR